MPSSSRRLKCAEEMVIRDGDQTGNDPKGKRRVQTSAKGSLERAAPWTLLEIPNRSTYPSGRENEFHPVSSEPPEAHLRANCVRFQQPMANPPFISPKPETRRRTLNLKNC